jgi:regulatory protein
MPTITNISPQIRDQNRVNISIDGKYSFSLDIAQIGELGVKVGLEVGEERLAELKSASQFGKLYVRALEYTLLRPHSRREIRDYLIRKTYDRKLADGKTRQGVPKEMVELVLARLDQKGYIDDHKFAKFWVENRHLKKGASKRRLQAELSKKGISSDIVEQVLSESDRADSDELAKIIAKKAGKYDDEQKLIAYLARQGFSFDDIKQALSNLGE